MLISAMMTFIACGPSAKEIKEKAIKDSIQKADSIASLIVNAESWDVFKSGKNNEAEFKTKYAGKKLLLKNLVINSIWSSNKVIQCLAYSPTELMVSNPSKEGDAKKKISKWEDFVQNNACKFNTELVSFAYYFELHFNTPADVSGLKGRDLKEEPNKFQCNYPSIITIEGDSLALTSNNFVLRNCVIKEVKTQK
jgi:hypothetical protein